MATIEGFDNYLIYPDGKVFSIKSNIFLNPIETKLGYLQVGLYKNCKRKFKLVHRLVGEAFIPNPENKPQIDHINRDKTNNNLENLRWSTISENQQNTELRITNNSTGIKNIHYEKKNDRYRFDKVINGVRHQKNFRTLEEAIEYKINH